MIARNRPARTQSSRMWRFVDFLSFETRPSAAPQDEEIQGICQHRLSLRRPRSGGLEGRGEHLQLPWAGTGIGTTALVGVLVLAAGSAVADQLVGSAVVIDGQSVEVAGRRLVLSGIVAPSLDQTCEWPGQIIRCGEMARAALMDLTAGVELRCEIGEATELAEAGGQALAGAVCYADGFDIGLHMIHTGWAMVAKSAPVAYAAKQDEARKANRGLWRGEPPINALTSAPAED